jgi:hypothetical protein
LSSGIAMSRLCHPAARTQEDSSASEVRSQADMLNSPEIDVKFAGLTPSAAQ